MKEHSMNMNSTPSWSAPIASGATQEQRFLRQVGWWMVAGVALTAIVSALLMTNPAAMGWFFVAQGTKMGISALGWAALLAPMVLVLGLGFLAQRASTPVVATLYLLVAACFGVTLAPIGLAYTPQSLLITLAGTVGAFAGFAVYGYIAKNSLAGVGRFAFMGLIGLVVLGFIQIFWPTPLLNFLLGCGGVIVFTLLTAWDVQRIRQRAADGDQRMAVWGALSLYLDFINLFLSLLRLVGVRR
jgi:uncharacterized protein